MTSNNRVNFVLCWHMHQPWYQHGLDGEYQLPWVYLHAIKDYSDMAAHIEAHPNIKVVVNFAPVLLEQLDDYSKQLKAWLDNGNSMKDPLLNALAGISPIPDDVESRYKLLSICQRANETQMIDSYPAFRKLLEPVRDLFTDAIYDEDQCEILTYFNQQYFIDVVVWYHLAWLGYSLKQTVTAKRLMEKSRSFNENDRRTLMQLIFECISGLIPRYQQLAKRGQIELSMSPYGHPIIPLLNNLNNMKCAQPEALAPVYDTYPGGLERSRWHLEKGIECFEHYFGIRPRGVWLSEGAISDDAVELLDDLGFEWTASGEGVWKNTCGLHGIHIDEKDKKALFCPYTIKNRQTRIFFRDDGLSDLIGFEYGKRDTEDAVNDFTYNLANIASYLGDDASDHVISVILDGENAWEYYPDNGYFFLDKLYEQLEAYDRINITTFSELTNLASTHEFPHLCAGSWVYGTFSTWIGLEEKNRAWEYLIEAKQVFDSVMASDNLDDEKKQKINRMMAICEGSDWFWWFGDYNPASSVAEFDMLFRTQLKTLYTLMGEPIPDYLDIPISTGGEMVMENAGTMRRNVS